MNTEERVTPSNGKDTEFMHGTLKEKKVPSTVEQAKEFIALLQREDAVRIENGEKPEHKRQISYWETRIKKMERRLRLEENGGGRKVVVTLDPEMDADEQEKVIEMLSFFKGVLGVSTPPPEFLMGREQMIDEVVASLKDSLEDVGSKVKKSLRKMEKQTPH